MNANTVRRVAGRAAWVAAWIGLVLAPIHALSRFATAAGASDLDSPIVRAWADPAADLLRPLLTWSDAETVYITYGRIWAPLILAAVIAAVAVWRSGRPRGIERWGWRITLVAYALMSLSVVGDYFTPWMDESFAYVGIPAILISLAGSLVLGIGLLRRGFRPAVTGWLLVLWLPLFFLLSSVIAMGAALLPMLFAWGIAGRAIALRPVPAGAAIPAAQGTPAPGVAGPH